MHRTAHTHNVQYYSPPEIYLLKHSSLIFTQRNTAAAYLRAGSELQRPEVTVPGFHSADPAVR